MELKAAVYVKRKVIGAVWAMTDKPEMTIYEMGTKYWLNSKCQSHREDGPAYEGFNGTKLWYINGKQHREDGPAVEYTNGQQNEWWISGKRIDCSSQEEFERLMRLKAFW